MKPGRETGAVLLILLWFLVVAGLLVAALAHEVRLSARAVAQYQQTAEDWGLVLRGLRVAEMELMLARMPPDPEESKIPLSERQSPLLQFDGRKLSPHYPLPDRVEIRIYDHAGRINFQRMNAQQLRDLFNELTGEDEEKVNALYDAWLDWRDSDDLKRLHGAEKEYYQSLEPAYQPRNGNLETLAEIRLIKGFDEVFAELDLDSVFTIYGTLPGVNPNLASAETLKLLPGLDKDVLGELIARRREEAFKNIQDMKEFLDVDQLNKIARWVNFGTSNFYTVAVRVKPGNPASSSNEAESAADNGGDEETVSPEAEAEAGTEQNAFMFTLMVQGYTRPPKILMVEPYGQLPRQANPPTEEELEESLIRE